MFTSDSESFTTTIPSAAETTAPTRATIFDFLLIGLACGLLPLLIGITLFPAFTRAGSNAYLFVLALSVGLSFYVGVGIANQALQNAQQTTGAFQGVGLVAVGVAVTFLLLTTMSGLRTGIGYGENGPGSADASIAALRVGLSNFAQGLAIGASFGLGSAALGTIWIISLTIQNIAEGLRLTASLEHGNRSFSRLLAMAAIAGVPAVLGVWGGGSTGSQSLLVLLSSVGTGAVFEAAYEAVQGIRRATISQPRPLTVFAGFAIGILALYAAGMLLI